MKIIEDKNNELLNRREIKLIAESDKNPSMQDIMGMIAKELKESEDKIAINAVKGKFGRKTFLISASIYNNKEDKERIEIKTKKQRAAEKEETKGEKKTEEKPGGSEEENREK